MRSGNYGQVTTCERFFLVPFILAIQESIMGFSFHKGSFSRDSSSYHPRLHSYTDRDGAGELDRVQIRLQKALGPHRDFRCGHVNAEESTMVEEFNGWRDGRRQD